jgi:hypothetical protein
MALIERSRVFMRGVMGFCELGCRSAQRDSHGAHGPRWTAGVACVIRQSGWDFDAADSETQRTTAGSPAVVLCVRRYRSWSERCRQMISARSSFAAKAGSAAL